MVKFQTIIFGDSRTGKSHSMMNAAVDSIAKGRRVIYLGKDGQMAEMKRKIKKALAAGQPSPAHLRGNRLDEAFGKNWALTPEIAKAPAILVGSPMSSDEGPLLKSLITEIMAMIGRVDVPDSESCFDVYCDEAGWFFGSAIDLLTAGNITLAYHSVEYLDRVFGRERAESLIRQFDKIMFFKSSDHRTLEVAARYFPDMPTENLHEVLSTLRLGTMLMPAPALKGALHPARGDAQTSPYGCGPAVP